MRMNALHTYAGSGRTDMKPIEEVGDGNMPGSSSIPAWGAGDMHTLMRNIGKM